MQVEGRQHLHGCHIHDLECILVYRPVLTPALARQEGVSEGRQLGRTTRTHSSFCKQRQSTMEKVDTPVQANLMQDTQHGHVGLASARLCAG